MRVKKWIEVETEVTVEIDSEDIRSALLEDKVETDSQAKRLLNRVATALDAITPEIIAGMGEPARKVINAFLVKHAARYEEGVNHG